MWPFLNNVTSSCPDSYCTPASSICYTGSNLSCIGVNQNDTLSVALQKINALMCEPIPSADIIEALGYTPEDVANKQNNLNPDGSGIKYPTVDAVINSLEMNFVDENSISTVTVGGIPAGTDLNGKTFENLFKEMLIVYLNPSFTSQSSNYTSTVEVGTTVSGSVIFNWTTSNSTNVKINSLSIFDVNTATLIASNLANDGSESAIVNNNLLNTLNAVQNWKIRGLNTEDVLFESNNITVIAKFKRFFGATSITPTTATVRSLTNEFQISSSQTFILNTGSTLTKFSVALPPGINIASVIDLDALNAVITANYVLLGTIIVNDIGGTPRTYNLYEMNIGAPYSSNHRHQITTI